VTSYLRDTVPFYNIFKIIEDITITFKGRLCNIKDGEGKLVKVLGIENG